MVNAITIKNSVGLFMKPNELILKFIWEKKKPRIAMKILKKNWVRRLTLLIGLSNLEFGVGIETVKPVN